MAQTVKVTGLQGALDSLTVFQRARIPGSIAWALNQFVVQLRKDEQQLIASTFNKTNAFTRNAPLFKLATKENPRALFFLRDNSPGGNSPDRYLEPQVSGGEVYVTRFSRALQPSRGGPLRAGEYVSHWTNPKFKPTPGLISAIISSLKNSSGPVRSGRQYARNQRTLGTFFIQDRSKPAGGGNFNNTRSVRREEGYKGYGIYTRRSGKLEMVYRILSGPPTVEKKYDWTETRMAAIAEREIPKLLFSKLSEF